MMEFERKYYENFKKMMQEADEELKKINESMTEEERIAEKERNEKGFQRLFERYKKEDRKNRHVVDPDKVEHLKKMAEAGKILAEKIDADIFIKTDNEHGEIHLKTGLIMFGTLNKYSGRDEMLLLMWVADDVVILTEDDAVKWEFRFDFSMSSLHEKDQGRGKKGEKDNLSGKIGKIQGAVCDWDEA